MVRKGPGPAAALIVLAFVCGYDVLAGVVPGYAARDNDPLSRGAVNALVVSSFVVYAVGLLLVGRGLVRRGLAAALALAAAAVQGVLLGLEWAAFERGSAAAVRALGDAEQVVAYLVPLTLVLAWGVARRGGFLWPLGLLVTGVGTWLTRHVEEDYRSVMVDAIAGTDGPYVGFDITLIDVGWWVWWVVPVLAGGVVCWLVEVLTHRPAADESIHRGPVDQDRVDDRVKNDTGPAE